MKKKSYTELKLLGEEVGRLRTRRDLSQTGLLHRLNQELFAAGYMGKPRGEKWLHRLENGQLVILPRMIFDALGRALACTDEELARLHLLGDRNMMVMIPGVTTKLKERFNYLMFDLFDDVCLMVESQVANKPVTNLTPQEMDEVLFTAIEMIVSARRPDNK